MPKSVLKRANQLYKRRKFSEAINLLESQIFRFRESGQFYSLLGLSCLYSGDFGGAESYLKRAEHIKPKNPDILLSLAAIHLKRNESEDALRKWLEIVDIDPRNKLARKGLDLLRRDPSPEKIAELFDSGKLKSLFPPLPMNTFRIILAGLAGVLIVLLLVAGLILLPLIPKREVRPGVEDIQLSLEEDRLTAPGGVFSIHFSESEIESGFAQIKKYLLQYQDNLALREINRIMLSNASAAVKEKANLMKTFVVEPDFSSFQDPFSYEEVVGFPELYLGCYVIWAGKVDNVRYSSENISFDLLVGYHHEKELLGIAPTSFTFGVRIEEGSAVEVLAQIEVMENVVTLRGIAVHLLRVEE